MKNIGLALNIDRDSGLSYTREIVQWLIERGCRPFLSKDLSERLDMPRYACETHTFYEKTDFLVVLGGDGTILSEARSAAIYGRPLIGINLGTLGYLTDVDRVDGFAALEKALHGDYKLEKRMMLEVGGSLGYTDNRPLIALNDICAVKGAFSTMITLVLHINNEYIDTFRADGIIIATPTGSTAYNLSAGGPILKPDGEMIAITPICPHTLYTRPWIISADDVVTLTLTGHSNDSFLVLDGQNRRPLQNEELITIYRSNHYTRIMRTNDHGFYDILRQKLVKN